MIRYILECIAFQLFFLAIYDLFLKKETFFQWNRAYLIGTYLLSLVLPWVKLEVLKNAIPEGYAIDPRVFMQLEGIILTPKTSQGFEWATFPWGYMVLFGGMFLAAILLGYKLLQLYRLRKMGRIVHFSDFIQVIIPNSEVAFSFFRSIFLGEKVAGNDCEGIIQHELVHIKQRHSLDLLFFELMRLIGWFNPMVYIYQNRISELHEFIADAQTIKTHKKEQYQLLLSQVFRTQNISFINQFHRSSLIKKRIVMLTKAKSKQILKLKYLVLAPVIVAMLVYSSCQEDKMDRQETELSGTELSGSSGVDVPFAVIDKVPVFPGCESAEDKRACFREMIQKHIRDNFQYPEEAQKRDIQGRVSIMFTIDEEGNITNIRKRGPDKLLEDEAVRIISKLPKMIPGRQRGHAVRVPFMIPITFKLQGATKLPESSQSKTGDNEMVIIGYGGESGADVPFAVVEEPPIFPGCENAADKRDCFNERIMEHIRKNFNYPEEAQKREIQGRVSIMFTIDEEGNITNIIKRGPDKLLEDEADRIISKLPKMTPGKDKGKAVRIPYSIPITFKLQGPSPKKDDRASSYKMISNMMEVLAYSKNNSGNKHVYGTVSDGGRGLPGVNIAVKGTDRTTVSDFDGKFAIEAQKGDIIAFQYINLPTTTLNVTDQEQYKVIRRK